MNGKTNIEKYCEKLAFSDQPIDQLDDDVFARDAVIESLMQSVFYPGYAKCKSTTVGLVGPWGIGKSSLLNLLEERISERSPSSIVVRFNPWLVSDRAAILSNFFAALSASIADKLETEIHISRSSQISEGIGLELALYATALGEKALSASAFGLPIGISGLMRRFFQIKLAADRENRTNLAHQKERVEALLSELNLPIVVLIDEMDRLEDSEVRVIAQLIKAVADFRSIAYVAAYDHVRVVEALGGTGSKALARGERYIEKLFEASVDVPIVSKTSLKLLLETSLNLQFQMLNLGRLVGTEKKRFDEFCGIAIPVLLENVRDVKRLLNAFYARLHFTKREVNWVDVLAYSLLSLKGKRIVFEIVRKQESFLTDHYTSLDSREASDRRNAWLTQLLGDTSEPEVLRDLVGFLFPKVVNMHENIAYARDFIRFEKSLSLVLRMEIAAGAFTRDDFDRIMDMPSERRSTVISKLPDGAAIRSFLIQVAEHAHAIDFNDIVFWHAIGRAIEDLPVRPYAVKFERLECARNFSEVLWAFAEDRATYKVDTISVLEHLIAGDMLFVASIAIKRFRNRLFQLVDQGEGGMNKDFDGLKFDQLAHSLAMKIASMFDDSGEFPDTISLYFLFDTENWTSGRRSKLAEVLSNESKLDGFLFSMFGGNYSTDRASLSELIDMGNLSELVRRRMEKSSLKDEEEMLNGVYKKVGELLGV